MYLESVLSWRFVARGMQLSKADVPFSFFAGYGALPAGEYSIQRIGSTSTIMLSSGRRGVEIMMPLTWDQRTGVNTPKPVFHCYGDEYFLAEVWTSTDSAVRKLTVHPP